MTDQGSEPLAPGAVIGMLGGGQLGRMAALAAAELGYRCHIFCPEAGAPATQVTPLATIAAYDDDAALEAFAEAVDVVTFEFENVPARTAALLARHRPVRPGPEVLAICQNRLREKDFCRRVAAPTAKFAPVGSAEALAAAAGEVGLPAVLKTTELGSDGKGQVMIREAADLTEAWSGMAGTSTRAEGILESFIDFKMEISVIVARGLDGELAAFVPVENRHKNHILDRTLAPARISQAVAAQADGIARRLAREMNLVGLLAIEMFVTREDRVLVNELAPRPHNSGHWTMDACITSQFEQFIRAVAGLPLGTPDRHSDAEMRNLLGDEAGDWRSILAEPGAKLHLYGKTEARPGRKMGHVNYLKPLKREE
jgi:5-(carboxyamino)imidazole ribonucleotide synthase